MTVRDLIRWGHRQPDSMHELALEGHMLLAERLRKPADQEDVKKALAKHCKLKDGLVIDYQNDPLVLALIEKAKTFTPEKQAQLPQITWTQAACRLAALAARCI